jgi:hypothetical protein
MNQETTPVLSPADLYNKRKSKDAARLRAYNKILEQIYNRVSVISKLPNSQCFLLYTVPPFILGLPKIDLEDCVVYLIYQLRHAGYNVRYSPPNMLYISWLHHEKSYLVEQSPIMQAMLESAERTQAELERKEREASRMLGPRKSQRKSVKQSPGFLNNGNGSGVGGSGVGGGRGQTVRFANSRPDTAINTILNRPLSNPTAGPPPPSAAEYIPPSSFLQNMTSPTQPNNTAKQMIDYFR